jgi:hypothetical protein
MLTECSHALRKKEALMLDKEGRNGGEHISERSAGKPDWNRSAGYALLQSQEPLPPYELDPMFDNPVIRKRIGELIANAMKHRSSKP